jgi:DNA-binding beta-propeller fold protein YncE
MSVFAGMPGVEGFADGVGLKARFRTPLGLAIDALHGALIVADSHNHRVRSIDLATARVTTLAGAGAGSADGPGARARIDAPVAVAAAADGRVFAVSAGDGRVIAIASDDTHAVTTLVSGGAGYRDDVGTRARLGAQGGAVWNGHALIVSDPTNYVLRQIVPGADAASTQVTTYAGSGRLGNADGLPEAAQFGVPLGLSLQSDGSLLVVDGSNGTLRLVR